MMKRIRNSITEQQKLNIVPEFWVVAFYAHTSWECAACIDPGLNTSPTLHGADSLWMPNSISPPNNDKTDLHLETNHLFRMRMDCGTILAIRSGLKRFKWNIQWMSLCACVRVSVSERCEKKIPLKAYNWFWWIQRYRMFCRVHISFPLIDSWTAAFQIVLPMNYFPQSVYELSATSIIWMVEIFGWIMKVSLDWWMEFSIFCALKGSILCLLTSSTTCLFGHRF